MNLDYFSISIATSCFQHFVNNHIIHRQHLPQRQNVGNDMLLSDICKLQQLEFLNKQKVNKSAQIQCLFSVFSLFSVTLIPGRTNRKWEKINVNTLAVLTLAHIGITCCVLLMWS